MRRVLLVVVLLALVALGARQILAST